MYFVGALAGASTLLTLTGVGAGAITGYVGGKLADKFTPYVSKYISNMFDGPMLQDMVTNSVVSGATGFTV
ncbi:hypothetical protein, partial [Bacteroides nordii]|uniref:hypothetical protein n=1 Tax=Bacteroides nordii TaxID=291645 RepID=UPI0022E20A5C